MFRQIEETATETTFRERRLYVSLIFLSALALAAAALIVYGFLIREPLVSVFGAIVSTLFLGCALLSSIDSKFYVSRVTRTLRIERKLLWWKQVRQYSADAVVTVYEEQGLKGNLLRMQLRSGQVKMFTFFRVYRPLDERAAEVNRALYAARH